MRSAPTSVLYRPGRHAWLWPGRGVPIVAVHGFTGDGLDFEALADAVENPIVAVDLVGHGQSDAPADAAAYTLSRQTADLAALCDWVMARLGIPLWLGYSMGARLSLVAASTFDTVGLALVGVHPGYASAAEAAERRQSDVALAAHVEAVGVDVFLAEWQASALMATQMAQPEPYRSRRLQRRSQNRAHALSATLRGAGTHAMALVADHGARCPVRLVTGAADTKFTPIARTLARQWTDTTHVIVPGGHACHLEATSALIEAISPLGARLRL